MSNASTRVTDEHFAYIAARTTREDDFSAALKSAARKAGIPEIWIAPEQASFMQILLRAARAERVLEVGTLAGYSAIMMARALPEGGRVTTLEFERKHAEFARAWIARSDVAAKIEVVEGDARTTLPKLPAGTFDAAFLDADKSSYPIYLRESLRLVKRGGLILVDNAFAFGQLLDEAPTDPEVEAVRAFNDLVAKTSELQAVIVPMGDGLWVGVRR